MKKEDPYEPGENAEPNLEKVKNFRELLSFIISAKLSEEYRQVYQEAADLAKHFVETKSKPLWDPAEFYLETMTKHPGVSSVFINAVVRCVTNYNPSVNIPDKSLWHSD